jgi:hypothetical protein
MWYYERLNVDYSGYSRIMVGFMLKVRKKYFLFFVLFVMMEKIRGMDDKGGNRFKLEWCSMGSWFDLA